ncbi:DsbA family protein, partial [Ralstonia pseudosolanacearum]
QHLAAGTATPAAAGVHEAAPACGPDSCALPGTSA